MADAKTNMPDRLWLGCGNDDGEHEVWFDPDEGGTLYVRAAPATPCEYCDGTGDVHRADGEWLGSCDCGAAPQPAASDVPHDVVRADKKLGAWLAAALDDENVCPEMKADIAAWFAVREPKGSNRQWPAFVYDSEATPAPSTSTEEALRAENARLREALTKHHAWHLASEPDAEGVGGAEAYCESSLFDLTTTALSALSR